MKYYHLLLLALVCSTASMAANYVIINQVMYDTPWNEHVVSPPYSNGEYVELYNGGAESVSLQGWELKGDGTTEYYLFPSNTVIPSKGFLVVAFRHANTPTFTLDNIYSLPLEDSLFQVIYQNVVVLSNQGETLTLYNANHEVVDQIHYDGTSNLSNPNHLSALNEDSISGDLCVSLYHAWVEFDEEGKVVSGTSQWKTDRVSFKNCQLETPSFGEHYITNSQHMSSTTNFILSVSPLDPTTRVSISEGGVSVSNGIRTQTSIKYYDGLGRPTETIAMETTPDKKDLVQVTGYIGLSRVSQQWLPVPMLTEGAYVDVSVIQSQNATDRLFTESLYENSALNRVVGHRQAGASYFSHPSTNTYSTNGAADNVRIYTVVRDSVLKTTGESYAANTLFKTTVADEDGKSVITYTDKLGRKIAEERVGHKTYYVYDSLERLRFVLPHIQDNKLNNGEYGLSNTTLQTSAYCYKYDNCGNMIYKRLPGCEPQYMVYDQARQLILKQDGNQREASKWTLFAYDSIGRNLYTAEIPLAQSHQDLITLFADKWSVEHYGNNPSHKSITGTGYASTILGKNGIRLLTVNYYDDYDYIAKREPTSMRPLLRFSQETAYGQPYDNAIGLLTGTRVYNLSEEGYTAISYYYDARGRVILNRSVRSSDGYNTITSTEYLFDGSIAQKLSVQGSDSNYVREHYRYSYDHARRIRSTYYQLNNDTEIEISEFSYDSIGRLVQNLLYNKQDTILYSYDIRDMLTETTHKRYNEYICYADDTNNRMLTPCYNGNISAIWENGNLRGYEYDNMNRLTAEFTQLELFQLGMEKRNVEEFSYDDVGNILSLRRDGLDDLTFYYGDEGNQLLSITENSADADLYDVIEFSGRASGTDDPLHYDANGNLIKDAYRYISRIKYNILNLPDTIQFSTGHQIVNLYDASGRKYRTINYTNMRTVNADYNEIAHYTYDTDSVEYQEIEYAGNIMRIRTLEDTVITNKQKIFNTTGYYADGRYYHYVKNHLGSICMVIDSEAESIVQDTYYWASGMPSSTDLDVQPYLYNGKEFITAHGLNEYDSQARMYYATIMRTTTMDPLAEKYYHISPYAWCGNNPIKYIDPDGRKWKTKQDLAISQRVSKKAQSNIGKQFNRLKKLQDKRSKYTSNKKQNRINRRMADAQNQIMILKNLDKNIDILTASDNVYTFNTVHTATAHLEIDKDGSIIINNFGSDGSKAHEMTHAAQYEKGKVVYDNERGFVSNAPEGLVGLEIEAYQTEYSIDGSVSAPSEKGQPESSLDIDYEWVTAIPDPNGGGHIYVPSEKSINPLHGVSAPWRFEPQILGL